ncbi:MAG: lipoprotein-releasing ABC transporter permease subunit [Thauera sp.]|jgi:lipoprotein-releasing system permease protein|nr:lipoprotein-releasing ABC transporter permease subunit [Thauera sp.]
MFHPYGVFIGARYTSSKRGSRLTTFLSRTAIAGLVIGVGLLILVLSVMNGFEREMRQRILGLVPHVTLSSADAQADWRIAAERAEKLPGVIGVAPLLQLNGMLVNSDRVGTALVFGIDPGAEVRITALRDFVPENALLAFAGERNTVILGDGLARSLAVVEGDAVTLILPDNHQSAATANAHIARFTVAGVLRSGTELDETLALLRLDDAQQLGEIGDSGVALRVMVADLFDAPGVAALLWQQLGGQYYATDWTRAQGNLYSAIQLSKRLVGMMLAIIIAVAAFNVVSALVLVVNDKQGDIAILRSQGATSRGIVQIFLVQGFLVGVIGTLLGVLLGIALSLTITDVVAAIERIFQIRFLNADVYPISYLPSDIRLPDVLQVAGTALAMSTLAAIYPAWRATRVQPAVALRYD